MAKGQYGLPTLYGQQYGGATKPKFGYGAVLNPFRQPPQGGAGGGNVGRLPPPQQTNQYPPGTHQPEPPKGAGMGNGLPQSPFGMGAGAAQPQGGQWWTPTPANYITAGYAYKPRQMPGDTNVDTSSAAYRQAMGTFAPSGDNQSLWDALPVQYKLSLSQWAQYGAGAYAQAYLDAMRAGSVGVIMDGKYMSGNDAAALIKSKADAYMQQVAQARQQNQPRPQPTPFRVGV